MSYHLAPTGTADTFFTNAAVVAALAAQANTCSFAMWVNGFTSVPSPGTVVCVSNSGTFNFPMQMYQYSTDSYLVRSNDGSSHQVAAVGWPAGWNLLCLNFNTDTGFGAYSVAMSINGANFSSAAAGSGSGLAPNIITIAAQRLGTPTATNFLANTKLAYPTWWLGNLTNDHVAEMYGSGPSAGDAIEPYLVNTDFLVHGADANFAYADGTVSDEYTKVGTNNTLSSDNPVMFSLDSGGNGSRSSGQRPPSFRASASRPSHTRPAGLIL